MFNDLVAVSARQQMALLGGVTADYIAFDATISGITVLVDTNVEIVKEDGSVITNAIVISIMREDVSRIRNGDVIKTLTPDGDESDQFTLGDVISDDNFVIEVMARRK